MSFFFVKHQCKLHLKRHRSLRFLFEIDSFKVCCSHLLESLQALAVAAAAAVAAVGREADIFLTIERSVTVTSN